MLSNSRHGFEGEFLHRGCLRRHGRAVAMTFAAIVRLVVTIVSVELWVAGCSDEPPAPNVEFLASDAHFLVAGHHIVVPIVALQGPGQVFTIGHKMSNNQSKDLKAKAADPNNPMR